jgi:hypothetical protein
VQVSGRNFTGVYLPQLGRNFNLDLSNTTLESLLNKVIKESPVRYQMIPLLPEHVDVVAEEIFEASANLNLRCVASIEFSRGFQPSVGKTKHGLRRVATPD